MSDTIYSSFKSLFIEKKKREQESLFNLNIYSEKKEALLSSLIHKAFIIILQVIGEPYVNIRKKLFEIKEKNKLELHELYALFTRSNIWEIPTKEICEYVKEKMEQVEAVNIHIYNGSPDNESITLSYAIIKCGIFGIDIPPMKCFDYKPETHGYSTFVGCEFQAAVESNVFDNEMDDINQKYSDSSYVIRKHLLPEILVKPQNLIKRNIRNKLPPNLATYPCLLVCSYPDDEYFPKLLECLVSNYETYNGIVFICDAIAGLNLPKLFHIQLQSIGYTFIEYGDKPTVAFHDMLDEETSFIKTKYVTQFNSNQHFFIKTSLLKKPTQLPIEPRIYKFEQALIYLMLEHIHNIKVYGIRYDINLTTLTNLIFVVKRKYENPHMVGNTDEKGIALPDEIFKLFFTSIQTIKPFINLINLIKANSELILLQIEKLKEQLELATESFDRCVINQKLENYIQKRDDKHLKIFFEFNEKLKAIDIRTDFINSYKIIEELSCYEIYFPNIHEMFCSVCYNNVDKKLYCKDCFISGEDNRYYCSHTCAKIDNQYLGHKQECKLIKHIKLREKSLSLNKK